MTQWHVVITLTKTYDDITAETRDEAMDIAIKSFTDEDTIHKDMNAEVYAIEQDRHNSLMSIRES